jgi:hypothetical protein
VKRHRSAKTGRYVTAAYAKRHPDTTITENAGIAAALRARIAALLSSRDVT